MLRFVLIATVLYVGWLIGYEWLIGPNGPLDRSLSISIAYAAAHLLRLLGFEAALTLPTAAPTVTMAGQAAVFVGSPCNGLVLYALFTGFIVAYPGKLRRKCWFIPLGIASIYFLNVVRVAILALNHTYWYHTVDFNHHYTFTSVAYGAIFGLWYLWTRQEAGGTLSTVYAANQ